MFGVDDALFGGLAGAGILANIIGGSSSSDDREAALQQHKDAIQAWMDVHVPNIEDQKVLLQQYVQTGRLTPELEQQVNQDASEYNKIQTDPRLKEAQLQALSKMQDIGSRGGLNLQEQGAQQKALGDIESQNRGRQEAILNQFAARGQGGSGLELVAQQNAAQQATNRASDTQLDQLGAARQRALQAVMQSGQLAGNLREQDYGEASKRAAAEDAIKRFNTQNAMSVNERNINAKNAAQKYNLGEQQRIADANVDNANKQQLYNKGLIQQQFDNQAKIAAGKAGQMAGAANQYGANAQATQNMWGNVGSGLIKAGTAFGTSKDYDEEEEE